MKSVDRQQLLNLMGNSRVLVLTANQRLARHLLAEFDDCMLAAGRQAWTRPQLLPFDSWCRQAASRLLPAHRWLTPWQELRLWEQTLETSPAAQGREGQTASLARQAQAAHRLLVQYRAEIPAAWPLTDFQVFLGWRQQWQERLTAHGYSDINRLPQMLAENIAEARNQLPETVVLAGFDDLRPDQQVLLEAVRAAGRPLCILQEAPLPGRQHLARAADAEAEVRLAARWARQQLLQGRQRVGIVATDLGFYQPLIERIFRAELDPASTLPQADGVETPFSLSLGLPLSGEGVVHAALQLLRLGPRVTTVEIGWLLRSPFFGAEHVSPARRSLVDVRLRSSGQTHWSWPRLRKFDPLFADRGSPFARLAAQLGTAHNETSLPAADWALQFAHLLTACGWPGPQPLDSRGWQAVEHFRELLVQFGALDALGEPLKRSMAVSLLQRLALEQTFQPESSDGPLLVSGLLESTGLQFDALWLLGMHDGIFPAPPRPNPLLPVPLQRRLRMPHADAERELEFSRQLAERLFRAAPEVVASYPLQFDGIERSSSPFVADWNEQTPELAASVDPLESARQHAPLLERRVDARARAINSRKTVSGGTALLRDQALCPFRAFAHHRLRAEGLEIPDLGLDARSRGLLVHGLLEQFWRLTGDHAGLLSLDPQQLRNRLQLAAGQALEQFEAREKQDLPPRLRILEAQRLVEIGREWLDLEMSRAPFRVRLDDLEKLQVVQVGALQIRTRIDRIDDLAAGGQAVIDYKTGRPDPTQWFETRLNEPQLPLYALGLPEGELGAVVFAAVRRGGCQFRGLVREADIFPKLPERPVLTRMEEAGIATLEDLRARWRDALELLADAFLSGEATVDPLDPVKVCRYCDLPSLCRIGESTPTVEEEGA